MALDGYNNSLLIVRIQVVITYFYNETTVSLVLLHIVSLNQYGTLFYFTLHTCIGYFC